jgi:hypothetical protein
MANNANNENKVITGKVRFAYQHVFRPSAFKDGDEPKYSVTCIIPKRDKKTLTSLNAVIDRLTKDAAKRSPGGKLPRGFEIFLHDGDEDKPEKEEFEDSFYVNPKSKTKPGVVDADLNPITDLDADDFYSGCYGRVSMTLYIYPKEGTPKGISAFLNNVQKLEDGENLAGSGGSAASDFGEDEMLG